MTKMLERDNSAKHAMYAFGYCLMAGISAFQLLAASVWFSNGHQGLTMHLIIAYMALCTFTGLAVFIWHHFRRVPHEFVMLFFVAPAFATFIGGSLYQYFDYSIYGNQPPYYIVTLSGMHVAAACYFLFLMLMRITEVGVRLVQKSRSQKAVVAMSTPVDLRKVEKLIRDDSV